MIHLEVDENTREYQLYENVDYPAFWKGLQQEKLDALEQKLVSRMLHLPAARMLDVGCGYGRLLNCYLPECQEVVLLDSSSSLLQQALQRAGDKAQCLSCDLHHIPYQDGTFDQIMMVRVFHHLPDSLAVLQEFNRLLKPGGHLLFSYCNKKNIERIYRWLTGKNPYHPFRLEPSWVWNVFFMHHPRYVQNILQQAGFKVQEVCGAGIFDKIAGVLGRWGTHFPLGDQAAGLFARLHWAPWIFVDAVKSGHPMTENENPLSGLMMCLACGGRLLVGEEECRCVSCGQTYPRQDGVLRFITPANEAVEK